MTVQEAKDYKPDITLNPRSVTNDLVAELGRGRAGADRVFEDIGHVVIAGLEELARLLKIFVGFPRKTHDKSTSYRDIRTHFSPSIDT